MSACASRSSGAFVDTLAARGYVKRGGNRLVRADDTIDVFVPEAASRARHNRRVSALVVDEVAGLSFALSRPVGSADVDVALTDGTTLHYAVSLPDPLAALVLRRSPGTRDSPTRTSSTSTAASPLLG